MKKFFVAVFFLLIALAFAAIGPDAPADDPQQAGGEAPAPATPEETEPPETFVPSEKLPADSAISFPVDI